MRSRWLRFLPAILIFGSVTTASAITNQLIAPTIVLDYPGATSTQARGINNPGEIVVGTFVCASACTNPLTGEVSTKGTHGFVLQNGVYARIDVPGSSGTTPRGISSNGTVVGQYTSAGVTHAFTYSVLDQSFNYPIDVPLALFDNLGNPKNTLGVGISPQGELVGCFHEDNLTMTTMHGWLKGLDGEFHELVTPHSPGDTTSHDPDTMNNAISATGEIVGIYFSPGISYIADESGIVTLFTVDGKYTNAYGVNARGDVVGFYGTNDAGTGDGVATSPSGFLRTRDGNLHGYAVAGASATLIWGIDDIGNFVGQYTDGTGTHGFVYRVTDRRP